MSHHRRGDAPEANDGYLQQHVDDLDRVIENVGPLRELQQHEVTRDRRLEQRSDRAIVHAVGEFDVRRRLAIDQELSRGRIVLVVANATVDQPFDHVLPAPDLRRRQRLHHDPLERLAITRRERREQAVLVRIEVIGRRDRDVRVARDVLE